MSNNRRYVFLIYFNGYFTIPTRYCERFVLPVKSSYFENTFFRWALRVWCGGASWKEVRQRSRTAIGRNGGSPQRPNLRGRRTWQLVGLVFSNNWRRLDLPSADATDGRGCPIGTASASRSASRSAPFGTVRPTGPIWRVTGAVLVSAQNYGKVIMDRSAIIRLLGVGNTVLTVFYHFFE